jgi:hypothetical protein
MREMLKQKILPKEDFSVSECPEQDPSTRSANNADLARDFAHNAQLELLPF